MRLSGNIKGNNREREKKELQGGSDREARKRRNHRGRRHEYREREKNREDLGWYKVLNWFWGKWKRHPLFHILRSPSTLIITIWWPQCSWSSKSSPCVPCLWKRLHHSLRYSQEPWASLSPLSRPHHGCHVLLMLTSMCITDLFTYLHLYCRPLSFLTWRGKCCPSDLCPLLQHLSYWQWFLNGKPSLPG